MQLLRICLFSFSLLASSELHAQGQPELAPGTRVRVWLTPSSPNSSLPRSPVVGTVVREPSDSLLLSIHPEIAPVVVTRGAVERVDLSLGASRTRSALRLALLGAIGWGAEFALLHDVNGRPVFESSSQAAAVGVVSGALVGAAWGIIFPSERWRRFR